MSPREQMPYTKYSIWKKRYLGASEISFKERFWKHNRNFKHQKYEKWTEPSKYIWKFQIARHSSNN